MYIQHNLNKLSERIEGAKKKGHLNAIFHIMKFQIMTLVFYI